MRSLVEMIEKALVDRPEAVQIGESVGRQVHVLKLRVAKRDPPLSVLFCLLYHVEGEWLWTPAGNALRARSMRAKVPGKGGES